MASPLALSILLVLDHAVIHEDHAVIHEDHKCEEDFKKSHHAIHEMLGNGEAPSCYSELELTQFQSSDREDWADHLEKNKKMKEWFKEQPEDKQIAIKKCFIDFGNMALEKANASGDCRSEIKEFRKYLSG